MSTTITEVPFESVILALATSTGDFLYVARDGSQIIRRTKIHAASDDVQSLSLEIDLGEVGFKDTFLGDPDELRGFASHICKEINRILPTSYIQEPKYRGTIFKWGSRYTGGNE